MSENPTEVAEDGQEEDASKYEVDGEWLKTKFEELATNYATMAEKIAALMPSENKSNSEEQPKPTQKEPLEVEAVQQGGSQQKSVRRRPRLVILGRKKPA